MVRNSSVRWFLHRLGTLAVMGWLGGVFPARPLRGQALASIPIDGDTGILIAGHRDFTRYDTPGWCLAAGTWANALQHRSLESQMLLDTIPAWEDTLGASATASLTRRCGTRFTAGDARPEQLEDLFELALQQQNDSLAQAVAARAIQTGAAGAQNLEQTLAAYLHAQPPRLAAAAALVTQVEAQRGGAVALQVSLAGQLLTFWTQRADTTQSRQVAEHLVALGQRLRPAERVPLLAVGQPLFHAYQMLLTLAFLTGHAAPEALERVRAQYAAADGSASLAPLVTFGLPADATFAQLDAIGALPRTDQRMNEQNHKIFPPFHAAYWFPATADTVQPQPGQVTLYLQKPSALWPPRLRRWLARYGARGLQVVYVLTTLGYPALWNHLPESGGGTARQPWTPATEAEAYAQYLQVYQQVPVTVAVQETPVQRWPAPDGRRLVINWPTFAGYPNTGLSDDVRLVGRDGRVLWDDLVESQEADFEGVLAWAIAQPGPPSTPARAPVSAASTPSNLAGQP